MINKHNTKHLKKDRLGINACNVKFNKMVGLVLPEDEKKGVEPIFTEKVEKI